MASNFDSASRFFSPINASIALSIKPVAMRGWMCKSGMRTYGIFALSAIESNFPLDAMTAKESFLAFAAANASSTSSVLPEYELKMIKRSLRSFSASGGKP